MKLPGLRADGLLLDLIENLAHISNTRRQRNTTQTQHTHNDTNKKKALKHTLKKRKRKKQLK